MSKHLPCVIWTTTNDFRKPYCVVQTTSKKHTQISLFPGGGLSGISFSMSRLQARMLARRITQMLEATK